MNLTLAKFFEKHRHLKITRVAEVAGIPYQRLTEITNGRKMMPEGWADRLNAAIDKLTEGQQKDRIKG